MGNGVVDAFTHTIEQYLTYPTASPIQDRFAESILQTLIEVGPITLNEPTNYNARAAFMWAATNALNNLIGVGVPHDWATHMIGHELTALHGMDHAQTLAVVLPSIMQLKRDTKREKLLQYAERVWDITQGDEDARIDQVIAKTREFFEAMGVKTRLSDYGVQSDTANTVADRLVQRSGLPLGERRDIDAEAVKSILELSA